MTKIKTPSILKTPLEYPLWENNELQFARLLCEISATQENLDTSALLESMDITMEELQELLDRAEDVFEQSKQAIK